MNLVPPRIPSVAALTLTRENDPDTLVGVAAEWLRRTGQSERGLIAVDQRTTLEDYEALKQFRKLPSLTSRNVGFHGWNGSGPILALDPSRDLLLKLTDSHLSRATGVLLVNFHPGETFTDRWLFATGAIELASQRKYILDEKRQLDPVVLAAFEDIRDSHVGQLCTPAHSHDPNGVAALLELKKRGHALNANALAIWAIFQGYSDRDVSKLLVHVAKVKANHAYRSKSVGSWNPNYDSWVERSAARARASG